MHSLREQVAEAVATFWRIRASQSARQGGAGAKDKGARSAVTGGAQMNGFVQLVQTVLLESGLTSSAVFSARRKVELPGWFRAEKAWDVVVVYESRLLAVMELKSHIGPSFGNNFNNRTEEALGSATDLLAAYREGAYAPGVRPWVGYLMLLEDCLGSTRPVNPVEPHFAVFPEFRDASYTRRYELLLAKLVRERFYDAACLLTTHADSGPRGEFREPNAELAFARFAESLIGRVVAATRTC